MARIKFNFLINSEWIENISYFNAIILKICDNIRVCDKNFDNFIAPLNLFKILIIIAIKVHVERLIISRYYKSLQEFIKNWRGKITQQWIFFLDNFFSQNLLALCSNRRLSDAPYPLANWLKLSLLFFFFIIFRIRLAVMSFRDGTNICWLIVPKSQPSDCL